MLSESVSKIVKQLGSFDTLYNNRQVISMSSYDSSSQGDAPAEDNLSENNPFQYDYFLSKSIDLLLAWNESVRTSEKALPEDKNRVYLAEQIKDVKEVAKFRTVSMIRSNAFLRTLRQQLINTGKALANLFHSHHHTQANEIESYKQKLAKARTLQKSLQELLNYLQIVLDQGQQIYYTADANFQQGTYEVLANLYTFIISPKNLWELLGSEAHLVDNVNPHNVSLGGNYSYYQNILRNLKKKSLHLKHIFEMIEKDLQNESIDDWQNSIFLVKLISLTWGLSAQTGVEQRQKRDFIDCVKGLYFHKIGLKNQNIQYKYYFTSLHLQYLDAHRMFKNYGEMEEIFIDVLIATKSNPDMVTLAEALQLNLLPFDKRKQTPVIQELTLDLIENYIGAAKYILGETTLFPQIEPKKGEQVYASSKFIFERESANGLLDLLMRLQQKSKDAFSLGDLKVHKIYLRMIQLIKQIYLSFQSQNWIFPAQILVYIPIYNFIQISEDIRNDVKKTLFRMVSALGEDQLSNKICYNSNGQLQIRKVNRSQQLQVILYFLQACKTQGEHLNLPQVLPRNLETSILYVKSLEARLQIKEPPEDQMEYIKQNLRFCEQEKVKISFKWFQNREKMQDRVIQFNFQKDLAADWMRQLYRSAINQRQTLYIDTYFQKYRSGKLGIIQMSQMLRYNHGINISERMQEIQSITIKQQDIFDLLQVIKVPLLINFDIFNLSLDEEISLNYAHICLGLYNISYKQAYGNEIYCLIMQKIMRPYLRQPNSSKSKFRTKYPCFFEKWIYSFQITELFNELSNYIAEKGNQFEYTGDIVDKIKLLTIFLDNKENIEKSIGLEQITTTFIQFSTVMSPETQPLVYITVIDLYCLLLNKFLKDSEDISIQYILNSMILSNAEFVEMALKHVKTTQSQKKNWQISILNEMLKQLPSYMNSIGFRKTFQIIASYYQIRKPEVDSEDTNIDNFFKAILESKCSPDDSFLTVFLQFLVRMRTLNTLSKPKGSQEEGGTIQRIQNQQNKLLHVILQSEMIIEKMDEDNKISLQGMNMTEIIFLQDLLKQLYFEKTYSMKELTQVCRRITKKLLIKLGSKQDLMFFADKADMPDLILCGGQKQSQLLVALIIQNKHRQTQTELLKKILRDNHHLSEAADRAIDILSEPHAKIHSYHINRLIQINNRYPKERIKQFLLSNLSCQRNSSSAKINQTFLAKDLSKLLQKIPKNICQQLLLGQIDSQQRDKLIEQANIIFEKLLYLPLKKFDNISLAVVNEAQDEEQWDTDSEGDERSATKQTKKDEKERSRSQSQDHSQKQADFQASQEQEQQFSDCSHDQYDRPGYLQIFTSESRRAQFQLYNQIMTHRQQLDIILNNDYTQLQKLNTLKEQKEIVYKLQTIVNKMNTCDTQFSKKMSCKMPQALYHCLKKFGLTVDIDEQDFEKAKRLREPCKKKPHWINQIFSDRSQRDDSEIYEYQDRYQQSEGQEYEEDDDYGCGDQQNDSESDDEQEVMYGSRPAHRIQIKDNKSKKERIDQIEIQPPGLLPTYSKVEQQISGGQLKQQEIIKLLEIALYMLLRLPESQVKSRQISSFYLDLLQTSFGQTFLQSFFTVIRFDQTEKNLEVFIRESNIQCGLQEVSMEDAINNILYLLKELQEKEREKKYNVLFSESGTLLPIASQMITKFQLPLQNNLITLLLIYISSNKKKIRDKIESLNFSIQGDQLGQQVKQYKLNTKELTRIIDKICLHGSSYKIWEVIQETMGLKVKKPTKLLQCIKGYGSSLYKKVAQTSKKIFAAIKQSEGHRIEDSLHIISRLVESCKKEIKQFYFMNKETLMQIYQSQDVEYETHQPRKIPKILLKLKKRLLGNKQLMKLTQAMFYFIKQLKDQFHGKIEDKMFGRLIHFPKKLIQCSWYYIYIFSEKQNYAWTSPSQIQLFFQKYNHFHTYPFQNLQQTFNLVLYFLNLQSFCSDKMKELLIPYLMKSPLITSQVGLRFKIPRPDEEINCQNILVTRKCSFDMAFYQLTGNGITVQFHEQEGSDHGGLVRQLMIGWRGKGVGEEAFFIGKILGISFRQGVPYGGTMDINIFVAITNYTPTIEFFQEVDPQIYRSLTYIRDNDPQGLEIRFVVEKMINGSLVQFQLIQGGKDIELNQANKQKYINAYCQKYFYLGREHQLSQLKKGFNTVVYPKYAQIFSPQQMLQQIRGQQIIDVKTLINKVKYQGYSEQSPVIKWFWSIVQQFNQDQMNTFIQFVTGSPKITVFNGNFSITIEKVYDINCLPVAHTCFNTIDLPQYSTREILSKKLMMAICQGNNSFGIL